MKLFYLYTRNNLIIEVFKSLRAAEIWIEENLNPIMKGGYSIKEGSLFEREEPGKGVYSMSVRIKPQVEESIIAESDDVILVREAKRSRLYGNEMPNKDEILSDTWIDDLMATLPERKQPKARYNKPKSVRMLEDSVFEKKVKDNPTVPYPIKVKFRDDTANGLTKCIVAHLELNGCFAGRVNTQGTYSKKLGRYIKSGSKKGMADVTSVINGKHVSIEVKIGKDKPREAQLKVKQQIEAAGGVYLFVSSYDDYLEQVKEML